MQSMNFFRSMEEEAGQSLFGEFLLHRVFASEKQRRLWFEKTQDPVFRLYARSVEKRESCEKLGLKAPFGAGIQVARRLDFPLFLKLSEDILRQAGCWQDGIFEETDWKEAKKIVFCEGTLCTTVDGICPLLLPKERSCLERPQLRQGTGPPRKEGWMPGRLDMETPRHQVRPDRKWQKRDFEKLPLLDKRTARIIEHRSGIRPGTRDRSPIIGKHEENGKMFLFNGFGSRGATTIPFYAKRMLDFMIDEVPLPGEADLKRFEKNASLSR